MSADGASAPLGESLRRTAARAVGDLADPWRQHPFLVEGAQRWSITRAWVGGRGVVLDTLLASGKRGLVALGEPAALTEPLAEALIDGPRPPLASLSRGSWALVAPEAVAAAHLRPVLDWDWMACAVPPARQQGEGAVVPLVGSDERAEVAAFLAVAYPDDMAASQRPDQRWWGWRDATGALLGTAAATRLRPGGPVRLGGIATHPDARRRGVASALTAAVTREALAAGAPWVSLAIRADNDPARALYEHLGFTVRAAMETLRPTPLPLPNASFVGPDDS